MADRVSQYILGFGGDDSDLRSIFAGLKSRVRSDVAELEKITNSAELFGQLTDNIPKIETAFQRATSRAAELREEIDRIKGSGGQVSDDLTKQLAAAEKAAAAAGKELARQNSEVASLDARLKAAGVDTRNLATEQQRLADALTKANQAAQLQSSKDLLGFKTLQDVQPEIAKVTAAYDKLRSSGTLSSRELAAATTAFNDKVKEINGTVTTAGFSLKKLSSDGTDALVGLATRVLAPTVAFASLASFITSAKDAAHAAQNELARIGTVSDLSKEQLRTLGEQARAVADDLGVSLPEALRGLFDLIRSGVPADNALEVLRAAGIAAKASIVDLSVGVKAANVLMDGFGVPVEKVGAALDIVVRGARAGGATLEEFANNAGNVANVARAAGVPLDEFVAVLSVMVDKSNDAAGSMAALQRIIVGLQTGDAREKLRGLGIEGASLVEIFTQLGQRNLGLDRLLDLGIASTKAAAGVAALTTNAGELPAKLDAMRNAAGTAADAVARLYDTPAAREKRFNAALDSAKERIGTAFGPNSILATFGTKWLQNFSANLDAVERAQKVVADGGSVFEGIGIIFRTYIGAAADATKGTQAVAAALTAEQEAARRSAEETEKTRIVMQNAGRDLQTFGTDLATQAKALQDALSQDLAAVTQRADDQIAALDRSAKATADTAAKTLDIQTKAAADKLKILRESEAAVTKATEDAVAARERLAAQEGQSSQRIALESAQARVAALGPVLAGYQSHYSQLIALAQAAAAKVQSIEEERIVFNETIEKKIRDIRSAGLSDFDAYFAKVKEIDDAIGKARTAAAEGDIKTAKRYTDEVISLSDQLKTVVNSDGVAVVSAFDVQQERIKAISAAAKVYNEALSKAGESATKGQEEFSKAAAETLTTLETLRKKYDELKASVEAGLRAKIEIDEASLSKATAQLDALTAPRTVTITVQTVNSGGGGSGDTGFGMNVRNAGGFAVPLRQGGHVRRAIESAIGPVAAYAGGGSVFRRPAWRKVPGVGDGDTVPALLEAGSFVVRKGASALYGDSIMAALAGRFAVGGGVGAAYPGSSDPAFRGTGLSIEAPRLPTDPVQLKRVILRYVDDVKTAALVESYFYWRYALDVLQKSLQIYNRGPTDENLRSVLETARSIGLNLGGSQGTLEGFDVDGRRWHKSRVSIGSQIGSVFNYEFYRQGGQAGDTVPAMLTPGEWVIPKRAAASLGANLLHQINAARVPAPTLRGMLAGANVAAPAVRRFETGGAVPGAIIPSGGAWSGGGDMYQITFKIDGSDLLSEEHVRRKVLPVFEKLLRRSAKGLKDL